MASLSTNITTIHNICVTRAIPVLTTAIKRAVRDAHTNIVAQKKL